MLQATSTSQQKECLMNGLSKLILPWLGALLIAGCGAQLEQTPGLKPEGSAFDKSLYQGYLELSAFELFEDDSRESDVFAQRAMCAATGQEVQPEGSDQRAALGQAGRAVERAQSSEGCPGQPRGADKPAEAAKAQVMFDCWMQEQEENVQADRIAACRRAFIESLARLEEVPPKPVAEAVSEPALLPGP
jgi:hypothetical protein